MRLLAVSWVTAVAFVASSATAQPTQISGCCNPHVDVDHAVLSPDGETIAYSESYWQPPHFYFSSIKFAVLAGDEPDYMSYLGATAYPGWAPLGQAMTGSVCADQWSDSQNDGLWIFSAGIPPQKLLSGDCFNRSSWSPDGSAIVVGREDGAIVLALPALPGMSQVLSYTGRNPDWGDGGVAYESDGDIWIADTQGQRLIAGGDSHETWPSWSSNGNWLVFESDISGNKDLWIVSKNGGTWVQVTTDPANDTHPSWFRMSNEIIFLSDRGGSTGLWRVAVASDLTVAIEEKPWSQVKQIYR